MTKIQRHSCVEAAVTVRVEAFGRVRKISILKGLPAGFCNTSQMSS